MNRWNNDGTFYKMEHNITHHLLSLSKSLSSVVTHSVCDASCKPKKKTSSFMGCPSLWPKISITSCCEFCIYSVPRSLGNNWVCIPNVTVKLWTMELKKNSCLLLAETDLIMRRVRGRYTPEVTSRSQAQHRNFSERITGESEQGCKTGSWLFSKSWCYRNAWISHLAEG